MDEMHAAMAKLANGFDPSSDLLRAAAEARNEARLEEQVEAAQAKYGKAGGLTFNGHRLVFRKPSRDHVREYRRKMDTPGEKADAMDQLAQVTIIAFDDQEDPNIARTTFTTVFLENFPMAVSNPRFNAVLSVLAGLTEAEDGEDLGKGVTVRSATRAPSRTVSPNGSGALSTSEK